MYHNSFKYDPLLHTTKVRQLVDFIKNLVTQGKYNIGDVLPSINEMSNDLSVSRDTVFKAYKELKERNIIISTPAKEYKVSAKTQKIFLFLDSYSPFKDILYESFKSNLSENFIVDLAFHHYNYRLFETMILDSIGRYSAYIVMNINNKSISSVLKKIDKNKILILDWGDYRTEEFSYVCQDFATAPYQCFQEALSLFRKYNEIIFHYPEESVHPKETLDYFIQFCRENSLNYRIKQNLQVGEIRRGKAYMSFRQKDLVYLLKVIKEMGLSLGSDIGVLTYNDAPVYEVIGNGITVISSDFRKMGILAADFVKNKKPIQQIVPTRLIIRESL